MIGLASVGFGSAPFQTQLRPQARTASEHMKTTNMRTKSPIDSLVFSHGIVGCAFAISV
jgi:hypothetical protein